MWTWREYWFSLFATNLFPVNSREKQCPQASAVLILLLRVIVYTMMCSNIDQTFAELIFFTLQAAAFRKVPYTLVLMAAVFFPPRFGVKIVGATITRRKRHNFFFFLINLRLNCVAGGRTMLSTFMRSISVKTAWPLFASLLHIVEASPVFAGTCYACLEKHTSLHLFLWVHLLGSAIVARIFHRPEASNKPLIFRFLLHSWPLSV